MSAVSTDLTILHGRSASLSVTVNNLGASGLNAYNDIRFTAKHDASDSDGAAVISKSLSSGITITTVGSISTSGVLSIALLPADTSGLPAGYTSHLVYDVSLYDVSGDAYTVAQGTLAVESTATQATT